MGGIIDGNWPLVCGGYDESDNSVSSCYFINETLSSPVVNLKIGRDSASSISTDENLYVFGGWNCYAVYPGPGGIVSELDSIEKINPKKRTSEILSSRLPFTLSYSCMVSFDDTVMILGGFQDGSRSSKTWKSTISSQFKDWVKGPDLLEKRSSHACGIFKQSNKILLVGGYNPKDLFSALKSTEILDNGSSSFKPGKFFNIFGNQ